MYYGMNNHTYLQNGDDPTPPLAIQTCQAHL